MKNYINLRKKKEPHRTCGVRVMRLVYIKIVYLKTLTLYYQTKKKKKTYGIVDWSVTVQGYLFRY